MLEVLVLLSKPSEAALVDSALEDGLLELIKLIVCRSLNDLPSLFRTPEDSLARDAGETIALRAPSDFISTKLTTLRQVLKDFLLRETLV